MEIVSSKLDDWAYDARVVGSFRPRGGRFAPWNFSGTGFPGIFNAWLPSCTPSGVLAFVNRSVYDLADQVEAVVDALGHRTSFTYDANGNQETVKNPLGFVSTTVYAPTSNRVLATVDPLGYRTTFSYDLAGQETGRQDARGNRITFAYDPVGRPRSIQNELGTFATTSYDAAGRPVTMLDANGWLKTITYDAAGQQTGILYPDNTKMTLQYDPVGNLTTTLYLSGSDQIVSYTARNEVDVVRLSGNIRYTNTYDQVGNRTLLRDTSDGRHTYSYDALNRVASFVSSESRVYTFSYDADSRRTTVNYGTGDRLTAYDALSRVVTQVERVGGSPILTIVDAYDSAGRKISQLRDTVLTSYTYDSADRLTGQQVAGAFATFTMDAVGNITVKSQQGSSPITMTYNAGSRLVTSVEGAVVSTYTFDANGNQTAVNAGGSRTTYAYDYENRMRTAIDPGGARSTMAYWADGMRRFLEVGGTRTTFVWDGSDYLQSRTPSEVTTFSTVEAQILDSETGGSESLLVPDPRGSVVKVLDASGNQIYDAVYWPSGEIRSSIGVNDTSWGYGGTWGYHFDMSRRLYIRARVLDPVTGRWYSIDPFLSIGVQYRRMIERMKTHDSILQRAIFSGTQHLANSSTYANVDPVSYIDSTGMIPINMIGRPYPNFERGLKEWPNYGNYCGASTSCPNDSDPISCIDAACKDHDYCLEQSPGKGVGTSWFEPSALVCHCALGLSANRCSRDPIGGCRFDLSCHGAALPINAFFAPTCAAAVWVPHIR